MSDKVVLKLFSHFFIFINLSPICSIPVYYITWYFEWTLTNMYSRLMDNLIFYLLSLIFVLLHQSVLPVCWGRSSAHWTVIDWFFLASDDFKKLFWSIMLIKADAYFGAKWWNQTNIQKDALHSSANWLTVTSSATDLWSNNLLLILIKNNRIRATPEVQTFEPC